MEKWKIVCIVGQNNKVIGYDLISQSGRKRTVTPQELCVGIQKGVVVNAAINNNQITVQEPVNRRVKEIVVNLQFTEREFKLLYPYISKLYDNLMKSKEKNKDILSILNQFVQVENYLDC